MAMFVGIDIVVLCVCVCVASVSMYACVCVCMCVWHVCVSMHVCVCGKYVCPCLRACACVCVPAFVSCVWVGVDIQGSCSHTYSPIDVHFWKWQQQVSQITSLLLLPQVGDQFMRLIEPVAAFLPYMTSPGNHGIVFVLSSKLFFFIQFICFLCLDRERASTSTDIFTVCSSVMWEEANIYA